MQGARMLAIAGSAALCACASVSHSPATRHAGWEIPFGHGSASTYADVDDAGRPVAIGVVLSATALDGLPAGSDMHHCVDRAADGSTDASSRCAATFEHVLALPDAVARRGDVPFKWALLNWNPQGHIPPGIYDVPHFDVHFMMAPIADVFAIQSGRCGPEAVRCDQFARAKKPVPANYVHPDFHDVDAVVPAMGNHLIDTSGGEFQHHPFTWSWIYGAYDGQIIFYEQMVTRAYLLSHPDGCAAIKAPRAFAVAGYYPTLTCTRHDPQSGSYIVSMEKFVRRAASPPDASNVK